MHHFKSESILLELLRDSISISLLVDVDDGLLNLDVLVEFLKSGILPGLLLDGNEELLDTVEGQIFVLDSDDDWGSHEIVGDLHDVLWHSGGV